MKPLACGDEFDGGTETVSEGRCIDFNLMTAGGWHGAMAACSGSAAGAPKGASEYWRGIYSLSDGLALKILSGAEQGEYLLNKGDFLLFSYSPADEGEARIELRQACGGVPAVYAEVWR